MNTEKKEHVVTEVYYPLGRKVPYLRSTERPLNWTNPEFKDWLNQCTDQQFSDWFNEEEKENIWNRNSFRLLEPDEEPEAGDQVICNHGWYELTLPELNTNIFKNRIRTTRPKPPKPEPAYRYLEPNEEPHPGDEVFYGDAWMRSEFFGKLSDELRKVTRTKRHKPSHSASNFDPKGEEGKKKPQLQLIPPVLNTELANALAFGAYHRKEPYGPWNWRKTKVEYMTYLGAMKRHIDALLEREDVASDSGVHHLGHIAASCAIVLDASKHGTLVDNRPPGKLNSEPVVDNGAFNGVE